MEPIKFLGATVAQINTNLGWGDSPSSMTVTLAEDKGEVFTRPASGSPATLTTVRDDGTLWYFGGIIQNWKRQIGPNGNPIYEVTIIDPRELLDGVQLLLNGYTGNITVPNVFNINGYLLSQGVYRTNGFSTKQIKDSLIRLTNTTTQYGSKIKLMGYEYDIDLSRLPNLPDYYKITDESLSLLDFIRRVCDDTNHDYFFSTLPTHNQTLVLNVLNRNTAPIPGSIDKFLATNLGSVRSAGYEFNNQFTSKFLMGGRISRMYYQFSDGGPDGDYETNPWENSIWPYWGIDNDKNAIIGQGINDRHYFTLDVRHLGIGIDSYTTDIGELRSALESQDCWSTYLSLNDQNIFWIDEEGGGKDSFRYPKDNLPKIVVLQKVLGDKKINIKMYVEGTEEHKKILESIEDRDNLELNPIEYKHSGKRNPHFGKATEFNILGIVSSYVGAWLYSNITNSTDINASKLKSLFSEDHDKVTKELIDYETALYRQTKLYTFIRGIAENYYGKQFMVRLPFVVSNVSDENEIYTSYEPADSGFIDEDVFPIAWQNNLLPIPYDNGYLIDPRLMSDDGKIYSYVRFDSILEYDYSDIPEDCLIINPSRDSVFIRCEMEPTFVYQNRNLLYSPRAIIKLPGRVVRKRDYEPFGFHAIGSWLYPIMSKKYDEKTTSESISSLIKEQSGADNLNLWIDQRSVFPTMASVALLSQERYGPWYASGSEGKTEYEEDDSLVPWNFTSWEELNRAAQSKVLNSISNYQISEFGSISVPGIPSVLLGDALINGGPTVTNISINYADEFTTTYNMSTWPINPYKLSKNRNDYISRLMKKQLDLKRNFLEQKEKIGIGVSSSLQLNKTIADIKKKAGKGIHSSHDIIFGQKIGDDYNVVIQPMYNTADQISETNKEKQAISSINNLFIPFGNDLQKVEPVEEKYKNITPNGEKLFPYKKDSKSYILSSSNGLNTEDPNYDWNNVKGIALRGPVMLSQWGYDLAGLCVPHKPVSDERKAELLEQAKQQGGTEDEIEDRYQELLKQEEEENKTEFHEEYLDPIKSKWPVGPIDFRWDDTRKIWTMGGYSFLALVEDAGNISGANIGPSLVKCRRYTVNYNQSGGVGGEVNLEPTDFSFLAGNFRRNEVVENTFYLVHNIDGFYVIDTQHTFLDFE